MKKKIDIKNTQIKEGPLTLKIVKKHGREKVVLALTTYRRIQTIFKKKNLDSLKDGINKIVKGIKLLERGNLIDPKIGDNLLKSLVYNLEIYKDTETCASYILAFSTPEGRPKDHGLDLLLFLIPEKNITTLVGFLDEQGIAELDTAALKKRIDRLNMEYIHKLIDLYRKITYSLAGSITVEGKTIKIPLSERREIGADILLQYLL